VLPKNLVEASEVDATPFLSKDYTLYGNYGFGHFLECFDSVAGFTSDCRDAAIHADPGEYIYIYICIYIYIFIYIYIYVCVCVCVCVYIYIYIDIDIDIDMYR